MRLVVCACCFLEIFTRFLSVLQGTEKIHSLFPRRGLVAARALCYFLSHQLRHLQPLLSRQLNLYQTRNRHDQHPRMQFL